MERSQYKTGSDSRSREHIHDARNLYNYLSDRILSERDKQRRDAWRAAMQKLKQELQKAEGIESLRMQTGTLSQNREENENRTLWLEVTANEAQAIAKFILQTEGEPTLERAFTLHNQWKQWRKSKQNLQHPLAPIVRAWIQETTAKQITRDYDRKHPAAVIERSRMGSLRDVTTFSSLTEELDTLMPFSAPAPESRQIEMPGLETQSILPEILPLQAVHMRDGIETTKRGAVAMPIRLFFEAMMALDPKETQVDIHFKLGDLLRYLNPDGKYNRTNHLPHVLQGLHSLHFLRIPLCRT